MKKLAVAIVLVFVSATVWAFDLVWTNLGEIKNAKGHYSPLVITGPNQIRMYANSTSNTPTIDGTLYMRSGTFTKGFGGPTVVISPSQITDQTGSPYIRTTAIVRGPSGNYYGLLHVGDTYPSQTGYLPAWATSNDGVHWNYQGKIHIDGAQPYAYSNSAAMVVQEEKPAVLDVANPTNNRFVAWEDGYGYELDGIYKKLVLIYSADGLDWRFYRDASGVVIDVWPNDPAVANDFTVFESATRTPYGYHMIAPDTWPPTAHRHLWSCDGLKWSVVDMNAGTYNQVSATVHKGTNLVYDPATNLIHALTTGTHFTLPAQALPCPP